MPNEVKLPLDTPASAERRRAFACDWLTEEQADERLGGGHRAQSARRAGELLAVWWAEEGEYRYPTFQFHSDEVRVVLPELLPLLPATSGSGWDQVEWLFGAHAWLAGETPADVLISDPRAVLALAQKEFSGNPAEGW